MVSNTNIVNSSVSSGFELIALLQQAMCSVLDKAECSAAVGLVTDCLVDNVQADSTWPKGHGRR